MKRVALVLALLSLLTLACSGESALGEECDAQGEDGECEDGAVCGKETTGALVCLKACKEQTVCPSGKVCNGVEGTNIKGCRNK